MNQEKHITEKLGRRVRKYRLSKGWSQMYLAAEARLYKSYIGSIERGEVNPSIRKIARIADVLGIKVAEFFSDR